jgi:hypothetical protein
MALFAGTADAQAAPTGMQGDVVFTDHSALSGSEEVVRRMLSPRTCCGDCRMQHDWST